MKRIFLITVTIVLFFMANFACAAVMWEDPDVRLTNDPYSSNTSLDRCVAADLQSRVHAVWHGGPGNKIYYGRSTDGGVTWHPTVQLIDAPAFAGYASIATGPANTVHVVWMGSSDGDNEIYYTRSGNGGVTWDSVVQLTNDLAFSGYPTIAIDSSGGVHVAWEDNRNGNYDIYFIHSSDGGVTWGNEIQITNDPADSSSPSIATASSGTIHVAWHDSRHGNGEIYHAFSTDAGQNWSATRLTNNTAVSVAPSIITGSGDLVHLVWRDDRVINNPEIYYKRFANGTWGPDVRLTNVNASSGDPSITIDAKDRPQLVWVDYRDGNSEIYHKYSGDEGLNWEPDVRLTNNNGSSSNPSIAVGSKNRLHVIWTDNRDGNGETYYKRGEQDVRWKVFGPVYR